MKKIKAHHIFKSLAGRVFRPAHLWQAMQLQRHRKRDSRSHDDAQLKLFSEILPSDFLHFGYFDKIDQAPEDTTLNDIVAAQHRYADLLLEHVVDRNSPVLDVGCGMGGLCRLMLNRGLSPVALTPDRLQVRHVEKTYPGVRVIKSKFEELQGDKFAGTFGTVITSESLQYLKLDRALALMGQILKPGGRWVASDYFFREPTRERSFHVWGEFQEKLAAAKWKIVHQQDMTRNVLPTLRFVHMWATRFGIPLLQFVMIRFRKKQPGLHHIFQGAADTFHELINQQIVLVDAAAFEEKHQYMMLVMERM